MFGIVALNAWAGLKAGAATSDITPPVGAAMAGYFYNRAATGVHDSLLARALAFDNDGERIVLITCDLTNMPKGIADEVRAIVGRETKIPASHVMVSATHAHTAPVLLSGWTRYALDGEFKRIADAYATVLPSRIAASAKQAVANLREAKVRAAIGHEPGLAFNRRYIMQDGSVAWNPGKLNPKIVRPAGPIDPAVPLIYVEGVDGQPIATYINFAIHLDTVGGTEFSADLAYSLSEAMKVARGKQIVTLFTMGCAGNINHINTAKANKQSGHSEAARIGTTLASAVLNAMDGLAPIEDLKISAGTATVSLNPVQPTPADIEQAHAAPPQSGATLVLAKAARTLELEARGTAPITAEVQVLRIGRELAWIALPGEIFVELGLNLKQRSPARYTMIATQSNAALGYIPNADAYPQGSYEVVSSRLVQGSGEKLVDQAIQLLREGNR